jgi:hypothetical protein
MAPLFFCSGVTFPVTIGHQNNKKKKYQPEWLLPCESSLRERYDEIFKKDLAAQPS